MQFAAAYQVLAERGRDRAHVLDQAPQRMRLVAQIGRVEQREHQGRLLQAPYQGLGRLRQAPVVDHVVEHRGDEVGERELRGRRTRRDQLLAHPQEVLPTRRPSVRRLVDRVRESHRVVLDRGNRLQTRDPTQMRTFAYIDQHGLSEAPGALLSDACVPSIGFGGGSAGRGSRRPCAIVGRGRRRVARLGASIAIGRVVELRCKLIGATRHHLTQGVGHPAEQHRTHDPTHARIVQCVHDRAHEGCGDAQRSQRIRAGLHGRHAGGHLDQLQGARIMVAVRRDPLCERTRQFVDAPLVEPRLVDGGMLAIGLAAARSRVDAARQRIETLGERLLCNLYPRTGIGLQPGGRGGADRLLGRRQLHAGTPQFGHQRRNRTARGVAQRRDRGLAKHRRRRRGRRGVRIRAHGAPSPAAVPPG